ncbi:MAG: hypothetical protein J6K44_04460 [Clostridia bacterium]|nr:hypothetical protein [Clostridia bacterium]MBQ8583593.1 hypothetical protein [Clostridia bacterium]
MIKGNQKATYEAAFAEVVLFEFSDVIATSPVGDTDRPTSSDIPAGGWIDPQ